MDLISSLNLSPKSDFFTQLSKEKKGGVTWERRISHVESPGTSEPSAAALDLRNATVAAFFPALLYYVSEYTNRVFTQCGYIGPIRATVERFYRLQDFAVDEVDHTGANLPMFLRNLTDKDRDDLSSWMSKMFGISILVREREAHLSLAVKEDRSGAELNIADVGFGFSQLLPVVVQLWQRTRIRGGRRYSGRSRARGRIPLILAIEQPELHLHPEMQAKIGRFLSRMVHVAKANGVDIRLVVETHSEHIVNEIGSCVSDNELEPSQVDIDVFYKGDSGTELQVASFDENGFLTNWPFGFFRSSIS